MKRVFIVPADADPMSLGYQVRGKELVAQDESRCSVIIPLNVAEANPHFVYVGGIKDANECVKLINKMLDENPVVVAFNGTMNEIPVFENFLNLKTEIESTVLSLSVGKGSMIVALTRQLQPEIFPIDSSVVV